MNIPKECEDHIKSRAILANFKILPSGKWQALIEIEIAAEYSFFNLNSGKKVYSASESVLSAFLLKIDSNGNVEKIHENNFFFPLWLVSDVSKNITVKNPDSGWRPFTVDNTTFPYAYYQMVGSTWSSEEGTTEIIYFTAVIWDAYNLTSRPRHRTLHHANAEEFNFPVQDEYSAKFTPYTSMASGWANPLTDFDGVYDKDNNQIIGEILSSITDSHKWSMSLAPLKDGGYLFGVREDAARDVDGFLYKVDKDGNVEQVGDGLKNFRLRELKKISKAKK